MSTAVAQSGQSRTSSWAPVTPKCGLDLSGQARAGSQGVQAKSSCPEALREKRGGAGTRIAALCREPVPLESRGDFADLGKKFPGKTRNDIWFLRHQARNRRALKPRARPATDHRPGSQALEIHGFAGDNGRVAGSVWAVRAGQAGDIGGKNRADEGLGIPFRKSACLDWRARVYGAITKRNSGGPGGIAVGFRSGVNPFCKTAIRHWRIEVCARIAKRRTGPDSG